MRFPLLIVLLGALAAGCSSSRIPPARPMQAVFVPHFITETEELTPNQRRALGLEVPVQEPK